MTARSEKHIVAIWNPASGSAPQESVLQEALGSETELVETTEDDPGAGQTTGAIEAGADIVVACGGDGTVRACLEPLAHSGTALAIVPLGTGNLLAKNLGLAPGFDDASEIGEGTVRSIDLGTVNGETFAVMAGSGLDALMIRDASDTLKSRFGTVAYVFSIMKNLRSEMVRTTVTVDGRPWFEGRTAMVLIGNFGEISDGIEIFPDARPDDGVLDVAVMSASTVREWMSIGWRLLRGKQQRLELARLTQGADIEVHHAQARPYELDGEARPPATDLRFSIDEKALAVHQGITAGCEPSSTDHARVG